MKTMNWCDLLIKRDEITAMNTDDLDAVIRATDDQLLTLAHGVSGIGNLLACAASNEESGLSPDAVINVGWMLESLGALISNVAGVSAHAADATPRRQAKAGAK
ncbi:MULTISPECIES: hypothetical protein [Pseudomonas syringae group]|uniref:DUF3077 domain-containing protein n=2 Tax=Pseudomonas syringae group TaxID=136849 RepID=A0A2K4WZX1_PSESX|nr:MULTISPECIES: hypothetical protein [Pseudomonas syringae group]AVB13419.1 hypothetical protein BKM19_007230 [Pseudomonas amygdali pv. morsprunorum]KWS51280.1 hypothetical protein AL056_12065 [Pseudomonas amygdali pv. morsprunorum]KWS69709.1 hypothetical protein AL054_18390 [Pseudomonas amygdali pv. morsprunorum]MBD1107299.1 hypothetical protein [Pseudomonas amygdali pv. morsprunorum]MBI6729764.1 hypothetical protein [Pseudomonas amygdali]